MDCELCGVFENERARVVFEDDHVWVTLNNRPLKPGHLIILPKRHAENLGDLLPDEASAFLKVIDQSILALAQAYTDEAPIMVVNSHKYRSQIHLHAHVLPAKTGLRGMIQSAEGLPPATTVPLEELVASAEKLRPLFTR